MMLPSRLARFLFMAGTAGVALACAPPRSLCAQQLRTTIDGGIIGVVTAQATGQPLGLADATIEQLGLATFFAVNGVFQFRGVPPGRLTLRVRRLGFKPVSLSLSVVGGRDDTVRVALTAVAIELGRAHVTDAVCPARAGGDTVTLAIIDQIRANAERSRLFAHEFPFVSVMERTIANERASSGGAGSRAQQTIVRVDTTSVGGEHDWIYAPGRLVVAAGLDAVDGAREKLIVPQLSDFAGDSFIEAHCFRYTGVSSIDGERRIRVDFQPIASLREPDVRGSIYLDSASYQITRTMLLLERPSPLAPATDVLDIRVDTWFRELLPAMPVIDRICMRTTGRTITAAGERALSARVPVEMQRLIGFEFDREAPGDPPRLVAAKAPACNASR
jgi:hypothetical protein